MENKTIAFEEFHNSDNGRLSIDFGFPMEVEVENFPYTFGISMQEMQWECEKRGWEGVDDMPYMELYEKLQIVATEKINVGSTLAVNKIIKANADLQCQVVDLTHENREAQLTISNLQDELDRVRNENEKLNAELLTTGKRFMYASK